VIFMRWYLDQLRRHWPRLLVFIAIFEGSAVVVRWGLDPLGDLPGNVGEIAFIAGVLLWPGGPLGLAPMREQDYAAVILGFLLGAAIGLTCWLLLGTSQPARHLGPPWWGCVSSGLIGASAMWALVGVAEWRQRARDIREWVKGRQ
jgi:drug/metabolite transporter (DMT)-like permease